MPKSPRNFDTLVSPKTYHLSTISDRFPKSNHSLPKMFIYTQCVTHSLSSFLLFLFKVGLLQTSVSRHVLSVYDNDQTDVFMFWLSGVSYVIWNIVIYVIIHLLVEWKFEKIYLIIILSPVLGESSLQSATSIALNLGKKLYCSNNTHNVKN